MKFRKRVKVFPGFYLNFSNAGVSSTIGVKGASINFSKKGTYLNTGIPGTGFYNRQKIGGESNPINSIKNNNFPIENKFINEPQILEDEIKSAEISNLTSTNLIELKAILLEAYKGRIELKNEIDLIIKELKLAKTTYIISCVLIVGFFVKSFKCKVKEKQEYLTDLEEQIKNCCVNIDVHFDKSFEEKYQKVVQSYRTLLTTEKIWDITSEVYQDARITRSAASTTVKRTPVKFAFDNIDLIKSSYPAFHFENKNGGDLYIYPAFVIVTNVKKDFGLIEFNDLELSFSTIKFLETEKIPTDTKIIDKTWAKVNKTGQPDKRFKDNYEIPIVRYGELEIKSKSGLNEIYSFSNFEKAESFVQTFKDFQNLL